MGEIFLTYKWLLPCISFLVSFMVAWWIHPKIVNIALLKNVVDNPDQRKLQRAPVPVLGGVVVFLGMLSGAGCISAYYDTSGWVMMYMLFTLMLYTGTMDDIIGLSPRMRFLIEIACVLLLVCIGEYGLGNFHGLWNIGRVPYWVEIPVTLFAVVGIINAINLIDGVDGLSSGYCVMASIVFGVFFYLSGDYPLAVLAAACVGGLIPFFLHNVFGKTSKMFIGDGGTLVMGMVMSIFVICTLDGEKSEPTIISQMVDAGMGLIPFSLAVLSVPVFDTLRVMTARILRGVSPFHADKTHLHHIFIELGFSHAGTTFCILSLNTLVVLGWWALYRLGVSIDGQLYFVVAAGLLVTSGVYYGLRALSQKSGLYRLLRRFALLSHIERTGFILHLQKWLDRMK